MIVIIINVIAGPNIIYFCRVKLDFSKNTIVRTFLKSNRKIVERGKIDTPNTQIHA
jgi:hypothetical protein